MLVRFVIQRILQAIPTLWIITVLIFLLAHLAHGDPVTAMAGPGASNQLIDEIKAQYHLNRPLPVQYLLWMRDLLHANLGKSITSNQSVLTMIGDRLTLTLLLALGGTIFSVIIAVPLAILSVMKRGKAIDNIIMAFTSLAISLPNFFTSIVLIVIFGVKWKVLPFAGFPGLREDFWGSVERLILPTISIGLIYLALMTRLVRSELIDVMRADYIRTARGKGLPDRVVFTVHALRNSMLPSINLITLNFASLLGGTVIIEEVFALPGMGRLIVQAVLQRDFPVIQGVTLVIGLVFILSSIVADVVSYFADPRISASH
ncbi:MAG TPA: ABC transporter permease [Thermomicrobiales bacterium]|nr:ABC transporter permease [Thermomicrobiales bacterium]